MRVAERDGFSGVVRVERDGMLLLERGYGLANRERGVRFTPATVVQIGSNTKDFTAVAVLQLVSQGKLSLDDTLARFFPSAPADKRAITVRQLLNHRAGFPLGLGSDFEPLDRAALVDRAMRFQLLFEPGTKEQYSNTGYSLLAAIIEQLSGKTYDAYVQDAILNPLGLKRTGFLRPRFDVKDVAHGYTSDGRDNGAMLDKPHASDGPYWNLRGNGGMLSTLDDMHRFYQALLESEKLLDARTRALKFRTTEAIGLAGSDGVSFFLYQRDPVSRIESIIASTNQAYMGSRIRRLIDGLVGRGGGQPAPAAIVSLMDGFVRALNAGDAATLRAYVTEHFVADAASPPVDQRVERLAAMHDRLGTVSIDHVETFADGPAELHLRSSREGARLMRIALVGTGPYKIRSLQLMVGDD